MKSKTTTKVKKEDDGEAGPPPTTTEVLDVPFEVKEYHKKALGKLLYCYHSNGEDQVLSYGQLSDEIGVGEKTKAWQCGAWRDLKSNEYIVALGNASDGKTGYKLSEKGLELASSFASKEELDDYKMPETNEEHHEKIKSKLSRNEKAKRFGPKIFDYLVAEKERAEKEGNGEIFCMDRHELAEQFNTLADSHGFFYGLQALKQMKLVCDAPPDAVAGSTKGKKRKQSDKKKEEEEGESNTDKDTLNEDGGNENKEDKKEGDNDDDKDGEDGGERKPKKVRKSTKKRSGGKKLMLTDKAFLVLTSK